MNNLIKEDTFSSSPYIVVGNKDRDLIIQTKGKVKILYGNKLTDIFSFGNNINNSGSITRDDILELIAAAKAEIIAELNK